MNSIINSDRDSDKRNSKSNQQKFFKSDNAFNYTKDKFNSGISSSSNSTQNKGENKINNLKFNLNLKEMNCLNNKEKPFKVKRQFEKNRSPANRYDENKLKLKKYDCIGIDKMKNIELFTPRILLKKDKI